MRETKNTLFLLAKEVRCYFFSYFSYHIVHSIGITGAE